MRAAIYARYSSDRQRDSSIDEQVYNCKRYAEREGMRIVHIYEDKAISGAVTARPGYQQMLGDGAAGEFDVLLVDELSRLSRDDYEMKGVLRKFIWQELRVIGVTDGYDSTRKGHKIHSGFKGLMNELLLDDIRGWTHRGMADKAREGYNCGGRTYGYQNVPIVDPVKKDPYGRPEIVAVRYEIHEAQAPIVRQIFSWYGEGRSYKWIASELNRRGVPSSRGSTWAMSAVKVILDNDMYEGRLTWNRRAWVKHPDTGKRTYKKRPSDEWIVIDNLALRIVPQEVVEAVRLRQRRNKQACNADFGISSAQRYLFSGLMVCAQCGGRFVIAANSRYGCASHWTRGSHVCTNRITVSRHIVEDRILTNVKEQLLEPDNVEKFKQATTRIIEKHNASNQLSQFTQQLKVAERVKENILTAIRQGIITPGTKEAMEKAEAEVADLRKRIDQAGTWQISGVLPRAVERYQRAVTELETRLSGSVEPAREILRELFGASIRIHRRGEHLEAEIPNHVPAVLAKALNIHINSLGCGGPMCSESTFVSLEQRNRDSAPLRYRHRTSKSSV